MHSGPGRCKQPPEGGAGTWLIYVRLSAEGHAQGPGSFTAGILLWSIGLSRWIPEAVRRQGRVGRRSPLNSLCTMHPTSWTSGLSRGWSQRDSCSQAHLLPEQWWTGPDN